MSLATLRKNVCTNIDIGTALKEIAANPHIGDELAFDLLDGRHIECAVTDINDNAIRFDSVDCLGDDMTYGKVEKWLDRIDHLLPDELQRAIIDTERKHVINGKKMDRLERLFLPAASELFSGDNVLGDKELETSHLMNIVRMLLRRPETVQTMLVCDIERQTRNVWRANDLVDEDAVASIHNATSMTPREIVQWVQGTPLFTAIIITLEGRGVNTSVLIGSVLAELGYEENGNE